MDLKRDVGPRHRGLRPVVIGLLALYGLVLPALVAQAGAHEYIHNGAWRYSVRNGRLDYINGSRYNQEVAEARYQWRQDGPIQVSETTSNGDAEIFVSDVNNCNLPWIGIYDYATDDV